MGTRLSDEALDVLFRSARTFATWLDRPVSEEILHELYDLMKWGPTSMNGGPARILFLRTKESKERLRPALAPGNVQKTMTAPVTAIIANDMRFYEKLPKLMPHNPRAKNSLKTVRSWRKSRQNGTRLSRGPTSCSRLAR